MEPSPHSPSCSACLQPLTSVSAPSVTATPCGHLFHTACLPRPSFFSLSYWSGKMQCLFCRNSFSSQDLTPYPDIADPVALPPAQEDIASKPGINGKLSLALRPYYDALLTELGKLANQILTRVEMEINAKIQKFEDALLITIRDLTLAQFLISLLAIFFIAIFLLPELWVIILQIIINPGLISILSSYFSWRQGVLGARNLFFNISPLMISDLSR